MGDHGPYSDLGYTDRSVRRLCSTRARNVDVRLIAATNRDPEEQVRRGRLREDLFWRLNVISIHVPPLRERPADIPLLAEHSLELAAAAALASAAGEASPRNREGQGASARSGRAAAKGGEATGSTAARAAAPLRPISPEAVALLTAYP